MADIWTYWYTAAAIIRNKLSVFYNIFSANALMLIDYGPSIYLPTHTDGLTYGWTDGQSGS